MTSVWSHVVTVSLRPMCHVITKRTLAVMGLVVETQALFDDLSETVSSNSYIEYY